MALNRIKKKLVADCSQCDALCCNAPEFETVKYKKEAGVQCKNLDDKTLRCQIYDDREEQGYNFCLKFDCHGAGQAVTKLFRDLGQNWQDDKIIAKIQYDIFIATYQYLSQHFFQGRKTQSQADQTIKETLNPFVDKAIAVLGNQTNENLGYFIKSALNQKKNKLVADCSQCDALCCKATEFEAPTYKKEAGVQCKNLDDRTLRCQIYDDREERGYNFCLKFDCHGAGQAVTELFRSLGYNNQNDKRTAKIKYDVFIVTYQYLSHNFFPDQKIQAEIDPSTKERLIPFTNKAIDILAEDLDETL
jgi:uncharacterized cysteine cluster protein YcgN (CxxCxxCC family)